MKPSSKNDPFMHFKGNLKKEFTKFEWPKIFLAIFRSDLYLFLIFLDSKRQTRKYIFFIAKIKTNGQLNKY